MSINVTVSGNPVRINRSRMVTACDSSKSEFDKRRLMRLEQVRQQSKHIAETVRNRVKKEKLKQLSAVEKEGELKLKNWQARKLLELQNQYQDALQDIGLGHRQAVQEQDEFLMEEQEHNDRVAKERGRAAAERLHVQKSEENLKKAAPALRRKLVRDVENEMPSAISTSQKQRKRQRDGFHPDSENLVPKLIELEEESSPTSTGFEAEEIQKPPNFGSKCNKELQTSDLLLQVPTSEKAAQTNTPILLPDKCSKGFVVDTRISDRIKQRSLLNSHDCEIVRQSQSAQAVLCNCCQCPVMRHESRQDTKIDERVPSLKISADDITEQKTHAQKSETSTKTRVLPQYDSTSIREPTRTSESDKNLLSSHKTDIPSKPRIKLKFPKGQPKGAGIQGVSQPVTFYDHRNKYSTQYIPSKPQVERVDDDNLVISPDIPREDSQEKMRQRDLDAQLRGQVALEKERLHREYNDLLKKLPVLQKQERICEVGKDKEKYHMARNRLEELEKKRQNRLDNAYEDLFVRQKPAVITIPPKQRDEKDIPSFNVGSWDNDFPSTNGNSQSNASRTEQLIHLLSQLKSQKDRFLKEIENTLSKDTLEKLAKSKEDTKQRSSEYKLKSKRKRDREQRVPSPSSSEESAIRPQVPRPVVPSPTKKARLKPSKKILVLQNTSTQTTPKSEHSAATSPLFNTPASVKEPCTCPKEPTPDDLCEIVIKIKEDDKPEITVNPAVAKEAVTVVTDVEERPASLEQKTHEKIPPKMKQLTKKQIIGDGKKDKSKTTSWSENLSQTVSSQSTTSTSYFDPPAPVKLRGVPPGKTEHQKTPLDRGGGLDPRLLIYIKKLLNMSRANIDDLAVSSSDISTPGSSVVDTPANKPLQQLLSVMKYFNLNAGELSKELSNVTDENSIHYNTTESVVAASSATSDGESTQFKSCTEVDSKVTNKVEGSNKKLQQYADIAASCTKKISSLTAMIEKVREEKKKMIQSPPTSSDDLSKTSFMQLPEKQEEKKNVSSGSSSAGDDEMDKKLLSIDYNYAEKLKHLSSGQIQTAREQATDKNHIDYELTLRLKKLLETKNEDDRSSTKVAEKTTVNLKPMSPEAPLFLDIPKLPKLETPSLDTNNKKKKPPPSKGLRTLASNIPVVPHELSTIIEADSQISTKIESPKEESPLKSASSSSVPDILTEVTHKTGKLQSSTSTDASEIETMETMLVSIGMDWAIPTLKKTREALAMASSSSGSKDSGDLSLREFLSRISSSSSGTPSMLSDSQGGVSLIQVDNRRTSTPVVERKADKQDRHAMFLAESDISSVKDHSDAVKDKFYDVSDGESKTR